MRLYELSTKESFLNPWKKKALETFRIGFEIEAVLDTYDEYVDHDSSYHEEQVDFAGIKYLVKKEIFNNFPLDDFKIVPDSSVRGFELVSPVYEDLNEGINKLKKILKILEEDEEGYIIIDKTCGLHISISSKDPNFSKNINWNKFGII
jgi:hypothetical protein